MKVPIIVFFLAVSVAVYSNTFDEEWGSRYDEIIDDACSQIEGECFVRFSAYEDDARGLPVNNLDQVAVLGSVVVIEGPGVWHPGKSYRGKVRVNPTWRDLCFEANEIIKTTGDDHHRFLEAYDVIGEENGIVFIELFLGS